MDASEACCTQGKAGRSMDRWAAYVCLLIVRSISLHEAIVLSAACDRSQSRVLLLTQQYEGRLYHHSLHRLCRYIPGGLWRETGALEDIL